MGASCCAGASPPRPAITTPRSRRCATWSRGIEAELGAKPQRRLRHAGHAVARDRAGEERQFDLPDRPALRPRSRGRRSAATCALPTTPIASRCREATDGAAAGARAVFGVILGTGRRRRASSSTAASLTGANAIAGEWGHSPLPWPRDDERPGRPAIAASAAASRPSCPGRRCATTTRTASRRCRRASPPAPPPAMPAARCGARPLRGPAGPRPRHASSTCSTPTSSCWAAALGQIGRLYRRRAAALGRLCLFRHGGDPAGAAGMGRFERRARRRLAVGRRRRARTFSSRAWAAPRSRRARLHDIVAVVELMSCDTPFARSRMPSS